MPSHARGAKIETVEVLSSVPSGLADLGAGEIIVARDGRLVSLARGRLDGHKLKQITGVVRGNLASVRVVPRPVLLYLGLLVSA